MMFAQARNDNGDDEFRTYEKEVFVGKGLKPLVS